MTLPRATTEDNEAFIEMIGDRVLDDWMAQVYGAEAHETVHIDTEVSKVMAYALVDAMTEARMQALDSGDVIGFVKYTYLLNEFAEQDEDIKAAYEAAQEQGQQMAMMPGLAMLGMGGGHGR